MSPDRMWHRDDRILGSDTRSDINEELRFHIEEQIDDVMREE